MTNDADQMAVAVLWAIAEKLDHDPRATEIILTRDQATVLACWLARELFGEPKEFYEELRNAGILR